MRKWSSILVLAISVFVVHVRAQEKYCYQDDENPYIQFSTKTAYELIRTKQNHTPIPDVCTPVMMWAFMRHGTRYPSKEDIEKMRALSGLRDAIIKNHEEDKSGELCDKDLQNLKNYTYTLSPSDDMKLTTQGKLDLFDLAKRLQSRFPSLLNTLEEPDRFLFFNDKSVRTIESREAFINGLLGHLPDSHVNGSLKRPNKNCQTWLRDVKNDPKTKAEYEAFKRSDYVSKMITSINLRLGFKSNESVDFGEDNLAIFVELSKNLRTLDAIYSMYAGCTYEKAWYVAWRPAFCAVFTKDDLKIFEYLEDLECYYKSSYGNDLNQKLACPFASDMVERFKAVVEHEDESDEGVQPKGVFYFSHMGMYLPLLTSLKMIKEDSERLLHSNYERMSKREFKTSIIVPFSANLVAVLYECKTDEQYRVQFHLNEGIFQYPGCEDSLCPWKTIYEKLKFTVEPTPCNLDFCTRN